MSEEVSADFIHSLESLRGYSPHTISNYKRDLCRFENFYGNTDLACVDLPACKRYLYHLHDSGLSSRSIHRHIAVLRTYWAYLESHYTVEINPWKLLQLPKLKKKLPSILFDDDIALVLNTLPDTTLQQLRDRCICETLYATGLRVSELVSIHCDNVDLSSQEIRLIGKGQKERIALFGSRCHDLLIRYLSHPERANFGRHGLLFLNPKGNPLTTRTIQRIIKKAFLPAGAKATPHTLRHSFATGLLNGGADLNTIRLLLGHETISTTQHYAHISDAILKDKFSKAHPRGNT